MFSYIFAPLDKPKLRLLFIFSTALCMGHNSLARPEECKAIFRSNESRELISIQKNITEVSLRSQSDRLNNTHLPSIRRLIKDFIEKVLPPEIIIPKQVLLDEIWYDSSGYSEGVIVLNLSKESYRKFDGINKPRTRVDYLTPMQVREIIIHELGHYIFEVNFLYHFSQKLRSPSLIHEFHEAWFTTYNPKKADKISEMIASELDIPEELAHRILRYSIETSAYEDVFADLLVDIYFNKPESMALALRSRTDPTFSWRTFNSEIPLDSWEHTDNHWLLSPSRKTIGDYFFQTLDFLTMKKKQQLLLIFLESSFQAIEYNLFVLRENTDSIEFLNQNLLKIFEDNVLKSISKK